MAREGSKVSGGAQRRLEFPQGRTFGHEESADEADADRDRSLDHEEPLEEQRRRFALGQGRSNTGVREARLTCQPLRPWRPCILKTAAASRPPKALPNCWAMYRPPIRLPSWFRGLGGKEKAVW